MDNVNSILASCVVSMLSLCGFPLHAGAWLLADSCETDRQEAAQRNRCTVMVAAVVGGLHPPEANSRRTPLANRVAAKRTTRSLFKTIIPSNKNQAAKVTRARAKKYAPLSQNISELHLKTDATFCKKLQKSKTISCKTSKTIMTPLSFSRHLAFISLFLRSTAEMQLKND